MKTFALFNIFLFVVVFWSAVAIGFGWWNAAYAFGSPETTALVDTAALLLWLAVTVAYSVLPLARATPKSMSAEEAGYYRDAFMPAGVSAFMLALAFGVRYSTTVLSSTPFLVAIVALSVAAVAIITLSMNVETYLQKPEDKPAEAPSSAT